MSFKGASSLKANATCLQGKIKTTFSDLVDKLGEPIYPNSGDGKVKCEWILEFEDGIIATIYCWKVNRVPTGEYDWHIGGHSQKAVDCVNDLLN
jgi:hypothetical protein